jgi:tetratricopeptide (TPR) repeat protein
LLATGDFSGAELHLEKILDLVDSQEEAWPLILAILSGAGDADRAARMLDNILASRGDIDNADALHAQSQLAVRRGELPSALDLAERSVALDPERVEFLTWAGRLALNLNQDEVGLNYFARAWQVAPDDHDLALAYADLLARQGRADESRVIMAGMVQTPDVLLSRILFEISAGDTSAAEEIYGLYDSLHPGNSEDRAFYQAQAAEAMGWMDEAIELYGQVQSGKQALGAGIRRAELMARAGDLQGARNELATMRLQTSETIVEESWLAEARILREYGEKADAFQVLDMALEQLPFSIPIRYSHALLAAETGKVDRAEEDLRLILSEQPENAAALNALGYTLADQTDRYDEAEQLIRRAYVLQPDDASIVDSMGWVAYRQGRLAESEEFLRRAWALDKNPEIAAHLGEVLWVSGKKEAAMAIWKDGLVVDDQNTALRSTLQRMGISL